MQGALLVLVGLISGVCLTVTMMHGHDTATRDMDRLAEARETISILRRQLEYSAGKAGVSPGAPSATSSPVTGLRRWDDTPDHRRLHSSLARVANARGEVMVALANDVMMCTNRKTCWWNGGNVLETFLKSVSRLHIRNTLVITLDDETERFCRSFAGEVESLRMELPVPTAQQGSRGANMISTLKYGLLRQTLLMGFSVLVVDLDLVFLKNPFDHLYRDADVEASSDGFTEAWAGGQMGSVHEPKMGWGAGGLYVQHFTLNVGCAFFRPTEKAIGLLARVAHQLSVSAGWDQQVFNKEVFMLSHGAYNGSKVGVRVMHYLEWVNSKTFFFSMRSKFFPGRPTPLERLPVMVKHPYYPPLGCRRRHARPRTARIHLCSAARPRALCARTPWHTLRAWRRLCPSFALTAATAAACTGAYELPSRQAQAHALRVGAIC
jgi:hypothetical protein